MKGRRVVITGLGAVSPLGLDVDTLWQGLITGQSGVRSIAHFDASAYTTRISATVPNFDPVAQGIDAKDARKMDIFIQYGVSAANQAIRHAKLKVESPEHAERIGVLIGSGIGGINTIEKNCQALLENGPRRISPFFIPASIINLIAGHVAIYHGFKGPNLAVATACTTGAHSIGLAARMIAYEEADVMVAGGAEYATTPLGVGGFAALRALSIHNDEPSRASRPFDLNRDGFVLGDGAGVMVLESYDHAKARGASILGELLGFGMSGDAYHMTSPTEDGSGAASCITAALKDAGLAPTDIDYINAHGTSTKLNDFCETLAIKRALGKHAYHVAISSTKSMTGHLLGAAGALEAIISVLAIQHSVIPPTINLETPDPECDLDYTPHKARSSKIRTCLSNSFGFGGTNGALIFGCA